MLVLNININLEVKEILNQNIQELKFAIYRHPYWMHFYDRLVPCKLRFLSFK